MTAAIIILYHPQPEALDRLLRSVVGQVSTTLVIDNTPQPAAWISELITTISPHISYLPLKKNVGIAAAQNAGITQAIELGCSHVLLLDQDSALPPGMVDGLLQTEARLLEIDEPVAAVGPQFIDEKNGKPSPAIRHLPLGIQKIYMDMDSDIPIETDHIIASGSLIRTSVLQQVGLMREDFFIDWVDIEWCFRAKSMGMRSYYAPNIVLKHSVGDSVARVLGRDIHLHNDLRNYYMLRNALYLFRLKSVSLRWKINFIPRIPCYMILYPLLSKTPRQNLRYVWRAFLDGICGRMGPVHPKAVRP